MPLPNRSEALELLHEWVDADGLRRHMLAVEAAMRVYARHYGEDEELWGLTGLLHDLDYDRFPDMEDEENGHPRSALRLFREQEYPPEFIHAIEAHATFLGVPRASRLDKALLACDELTGLILACAYVRPDRDLRGVRLKSVKKKVEGQALHGRDRPGRESALHRGAGRTVRRARTARTGRDEGNRGGPGPGGRTGLNGGPLSRCGRQADGSAASASRTRAGVNGRERMRLPVAAAKALATAAPTGAIGGSPMP